MNWSFTLSCFKSKSFYHYNSLSYVNNTIAVKQNIPLRATIILATTYHDKKLS
jgi:hypothetical protein